MQTLNASDFQSRCLALMDHVVSTGESVLVMKNGKPVAELRPISPSHVASPFGLHKGKTKILGDIITPFNDEDWEALK